jgi:hypothetical protein
LLQLAQLQKERREMLRMRLSHPTFNFDRPATSGTSRELVSSSIVAANKTTINAIRTTALPRPDHHA